MAFPYGTRGFYQGFDFAGGGGLTGGLQMPTPPAGYGSNPSGRGASQGGGTSSGEVASGVTFDSGRGAAGGGGTGANAGYSGTGGKANATGGNAAVPYDPSGGANNQQQITDPSFQPIWQRQGYGSLGDWRQQAFRINQNPMTNQGWFNPAAMSGYNPQYGYSANQFMNPMWAAISNQPYYQGNPGAAGGPSMPGGWTMQREPDGSIVYSQPNGNYWLRYNPRLGWYDSRNPTAGFRAGYKDGRLSLGGLQNTTGQGGETATPQLSGYTPPLLY